MYIAGEKGGGEVWSKRDVTIKVYNNVHLVHRYSGTWQFSENGSPMYTSTAVSDKITLLS